MEHDYGYTTLVYPTFSPCCHSAVLACVILGRSQPRQTAEVAEGVSAHPSTGAMFAACSERAHLCRGTRARRCKPIRSPQALNGNHTRVRHHSAYTHAPHRLALGFHRSRRFGAELDGGGPKGEWAGFIQMSNITSFPRVLDPGGPSTGRGRLDLL